MKIYNFNSLIFCLQDSRIDAAEAKVLKRWLEERQMEDEFAFMIEKLSRFLSDGYVDRFESKEVVDSLGQVLVKLNVKEGGM